MQPNWGVGRIALSYKEAINLLISLAVTDMMDASLLTGHLKPIQRKLIATFSRPDQRKIKQLRNRLRAGPVIPATTLQAYALTQGGQVTDRLQEAFLMMRKARIRYQSKQRVRTRRTVEVHYLVLGYPVWYALCWDKLRSAVRSFRLDRIESVELRDTVFTLRPYSEFEESM
ncbi:MAG: WYL domain-containing protein, partial [Pseudomonadota bacterium]